MFSVTLVNNCIALTCLRSSRFFNGRIILQNNLTSPPLLIVPVVRSLQTTSAQNILLPLDHFVVKHGNFCCKTNYTNFSTSIVLHLERKGTEQQLALLLAVQCTALQSQRKRRECGSRCSRRHHNQNSILVTLPLNHLHLLLQILEIVPLNHHHLLLQIDAGTLQILACPRLHASPPPVPVHAASFSPVSRAIQSLHRQNAPFLPCLVGPLWKE